MGLEPLPIEGSWVFTPKVHGDSRGMFLELFKDSPFRAATGHPLTLAQANCSVSRRGTVRGIHFADVPPGQAKYITCLTGAILDVIVDIRTGSPTYGQWTTVRLDTDDRRAVYLSEGLGHGFAALADNTTVMYLCSEEYAPDREREIHPLDPDLAIDWGLPDSELELSAKDSVAPGLAEANAAGMLPDYSACLAYRESLSRA